MVFKLRLREQEKLKIDLLPEEVKLLVPDALHIFAAEVNPRILEMHYSERTQQLNIPLSQYSFRTLQQLSAQYKVSRSIILVSALVYFGKVAAKTREKRLDGELLRKIKLFRRQNPGIITPIITQQIVQGRALFDIPGLPQQLLGL